MTTITAPNPHNVRIQYGKHSGELFTRLPLSYLRWMVQASAPGSATAKAELDRRGTPLPDMEISHHAIDRASLRLRKAWHQDAEQWKDSELGLYSWLLRRAQMALKHGERGEDGKVVHDGIVFKFGMDGTWPLLLTVMPAKRHGTGRAPGSKSAGDREDNA